MTIKETERAIVSKILDFYQEFDKATVTIYDYANEEKPSFADQTHYFKDGILIDM